MLKNSEVNYEEKSSDQEQESGSELFSSNRSSGEERQSVQPSRWSSLVKDESHVVNYLAVLGCQYDGLTLPVVNICYRFAPEVEDSCGFRAAAFLPFARQLIDNKDVEGISYLHIVGAVCDDGCIISFGKNYIDLTKEFNEVLESERNKD